MSEEPTDDQREQALATKLFDLAEDPFGKYDPYLAHTLFKARSTCDDQRRRRARLRLADDLLDAAITGAKGKSTKAIRALLDIDTLRSSKNQETDIKAALEALRKDSGYLFDDGKMPPPYAGKTGTGQQEPNGEPTTLAGALRANYNMK